MSSNSQSSPTLAALLAQYPTLSQRERLHMHIRWRVCPLPRIAALVPTNGLIVDLGCGHGLFPLLLTAQAPTRQVLGVDLDAEKIALAKTLRVPNLQFECGDIAETPFPPAQAVTILDVFYLVPFDVQEKLLAICVEKLAPGGVLVLKDMAEMPRWKVGLNWLEETLAVRVLKITETTAPQFYFRPRREWVALFERLSLTVETIPLDRGYYHPHVAFVGRKKN